LPLDERCGPLVPAGAGAEPDGRRSSEALAQVALLLRLERRSGGRLRLVRDAADLDGGVLAAVLAPRGRRADRAGGP
jgi:hypothetical protein